MNNTEYLNEEKYQRGRKALIRTAVIIIVLGLLAGGGLIVGGIIRKNSASQINASTITQSVNTNYDEIAKEGSAMIDNSMTKRSEEFGASAMIGGGVFVIFASLMVSVPFFLFANQRKIIAFQAQTVAPVAKEGVEKATPVISKAAGSIAREISKGIKEGKAEGTGGKEESED